jgi:UDP-glucuronate 4-epimerase
MNILVTGACGFIGSNLCESLLEDGHTVTGVDAFTENYSEELKRSNQRALMKFANFEILELDLLETNLNQILDGKDLVFHLAGQPSVHNSWGVDFQTYSDRNIVLTQRLLRAAVEVQTPKFINSSSSSIYGRVQTTPTAEGDEKLPISPYGVTKLAGENLVTLFGSELGLNTVSLRYFTVYGPRQRPDMAFNKLISAGLTGVRFPLHGDGTQVRDFTFVGDVVEANKLAAFSDVTPGSVFNIGGGSPVSMNRVISVLEEILNSRISIDIAPFGPGNPMVTTADCGAIEKTLGWKPKVDIYNGLKAQIEWQMS